MKNSEMGGLNVDGDGERAKNRENGSSWPPPRSHVQHRRSKRHGLYLLFLFVLSHCCP